MPGFTSRDDMISEITVNGKQLCGNFYKASLTGVSTGMWSSSWKNVGAPNAGVDPAATPGTVYSGDITPFAGGICFPDKTPDVKSLVSLGVLHTANGILRLYDRLVGVGGVVINATGVKTINTQALPRYSGVEAVNTEVWLELTGAASVTPAQVNINSYTSADGTTGLSGPTVVYSTAAQPASVMIQLPLNPTKQGCLSVESINVSVACSGGAANLLIINPIVSVPLLANVWTEYSFLEDSKGMPVIKDNAVLAMMMFAYTNTATQLYGCANVAYG